MSNNAQPIQSSAAALLNKLVVDHGLKTYTALARRLDVAPPTISNILNGHTPVGATLILRIHDAFAMPIAEIKALIADPAAK